MNKWFIGIGIVVIALTIIYQPSFGFAFQRFLLGSTTAQNIDAPTQLALQVTSLKSELAQSIEASQRANAWPTNAEPAFVYSRYPFNFKSELVITAGKDRGIEPGMPVVLPLREGAGEKPVMLGKIVAVYEKSALVRTVFDTAFQIPVRVGVHGIDALFVGGPEPKLTLIPKQSEISPGEAVYAAASEFPFGLPLGTAGEVALGPNQVFRESLMALPYDLNDIKMVAVLKDKR